MTPHLVFDLLAYLGALLVAKVAIKERYRFENERLKWHYYTALVVGFVAGAVLLSILNNTLSLGKLYVGKSILGAIAGAIVAAELFKRRYGIRGSTGAYFVPSLALGIAVGRIGCFLTGLKDFTYGIPTDLPWGVDFGDGVTRHPVQLYESAAMSGFFLFLLWLYRHKKERFEQKGFYYFVLFYGAQRFVWEFLKPYVTVAFGLNLFQIVSIALMLYAASYLKRSAHGTLYTKV